MRKILLGVILALSLVAQTGTPVNFTVGTLSGNAANKGTFAAVALNYTPTVYPATLTITDGANTITITRAGASAPWILGQSLP